MQRRVRGVWLGAVLAWGVASPAWAQDVEVFDAPRIFSIQERPFRLGHEFQLGLGVLPTNAFYVGAVLAGSYTYHFTDFWAWEIASFGYSMNFDTSLEDELHDEFGVAPVGGGGERIHMFGASSLVAKPLFGKLAVFNESTVYSETFFSLGAGPVLKGEFWRFAAQVGMGLRFWSSDALSVRFDLRDYLIFTGWVPENALFLMLSASFNFFDKAAQQADAAAFSAR